MYIRCKKFSNSSRRVLAIYHSVREGNKVSQKLIKYIGTAHSDEQYAILMKIAQDELKDLSCSSKRTSSKSSTLDLCDGVCLADLIEEGRIVEGFHEICSSILDRVGLNSSLSPYRYRQLKNVVISRIARPASKRQTAHILNEEFGLQITEDQIYRFMDEVLQHEEEIKIKIFENSRSLCEKQIIDLLLFDVTTLYFESQKSDEIRDFGYSKDHKVGEVQVVLALATTSRGLPIGYHLFSGKTAETKTLLKSLEEWKKLFVIDHVIVIADRAMMSEANLLAMEQAGIEYIVACKLKNLPKKLQTEILERKSEVEAEVSGESIRIQEHKYKNSRLIVGWSKSRAEKDRGDRQRLIAKLKAKLDKSADTKKLISNRGYLKFTDEKRVGSVSLNEEKIAKDALWDGLHGVVTNNFTISVTEVLARYKRLFIIEESFRINKHTLAMRPIYHFKPDRIKAHVLICYIAFAISRYLQFHVSAFDQALSIERIREALFSVQASLLRNKDNDHLYRLPSDINEDAKIIYKAFNIKRSRHPSRINTKRKCSATKKIQTLNSKADAKL